MNNGVPIMDDEMQRTNGDRIRAMSDEELAEWIAHIHCPHYGEDDYPCDSCAECWTEWMKQEAKHEQS